MRIKVVAYSDAGNIIATAQDEPDCFFVLKQQSELPINLGDSLDWKFGDETITLQQVENVNKKRSVGMSMECLNGTLRQAISVFVEGLEALKFRTFIYAGKERFISNADDINECAKFECLKPLDKNTDRLP